jgi:hypothetical protein
MTCPCDGFVFPQRASIPAALARLPRALGGFPEWRSALLAAIGEQPPLDDWRARDAQDLGLMLVEMGAYVFDVVSFYDGVIAGESYLRTATLTGAQRRHVGLLGYLPRPAVAAEALLAAEADARALVALPVGTAFRSGEFDGQPPQVFELTRAAAVDARINRMAVSRVRETQLPAAFASLLVEPGTLRARPGTALAFDFDGVLMATRMGGSAVAALRSKVPATRVDFGAAIAPPAGTAYVDTRLLRAGATTGLWTLGTVSGETAVLSGSTLLLASRLPIRAGEVVMLEHGNTLLAHRVVSVAEELRTLLGAQTSTITDSASKTSTLVSPAIRIAVTRLTLDAAPAWSGVALEKVVVHHACSDAAKLLPPIKDTLDDDDPIVVPGLIDPPRTVVEDLLLEDVHGEGVATTGVLDAATRTASLDSGQDWGKVLWAPVQLYGNVLPVSRGESVWAEMLGVGDASAAEQTFTLKKKPLTYVNAANAAGIASTLSVRVGGVRWREVATFYGQDPQAQVYIVRQDDAGDTHLTFGGCARLPSGAAVVADYRFGAGAAAPPAGSIKQIAKSVAGLRAVHNVLPAFGGADAESAAELSTFAPRSALLLGRAISLVDLEAAAAQVGGVRAARAAWRWDDKGLRPAAIVAYIGDAQLRPSLLAKLRALSEPDAPIVVTVSPPQPASLRIGIVIHPDHAAAQVIAAVQEALFATVGLPGSGGLLRAERLGPDGIVFLSHIVHAAMQVAGVAGIDGVHFDQTPFVESGRRPGAGMHFDFDQGGVWVNGERAPG